MSIAFSGTAATDQPSGYFWCTLTAPGADQLGWDTASCSHAPEVPCSGQLGCKVDEMAGAVWNGQAPKRWSYVRQMLMRQLGERVEVFGVWEYQKRGVLHRHFLVRVYGPVTERRFRSSFAHVRDQLGFGSMSDVQHITAECASELARHVGYCAKYASKTATALEDGGRVLDIKTGELKRSRGFRTWSQSLRWGQTMKELKAQSIAYARAAAAVRSTPTMLGDAEGGALDSYSGTSTGGVPSRVIEVPAHPVYGMS